MEATLEPTLEGTEGEKHLWVTAYLNSFYDAGASDDASGLVSILSAAGALQQLNLVDTVHLVAYDLMEEVGLIGSTLYAGSAVSDLRERQGEGAIVGKLHSDTVGYDEGDSDAVVTCDRPIDEAALRASESIDSSIKQAINARPTPITGTAGPPVFPRS